MTIKNHTYTNQLDKETKNSNHLHSSQTRLTSKDTSKTINQLTQYDFQLLLKMLASIIILPSFNQI